MRQARTIPATSSAAADVERARRMRAGALAGATGRNRRDQSLALMTGEVVGVPVHIARNLGQSFRAEILGDLRGETVLSARDRHFTYVVDREGLAASIIDATRRAIIWARQRARLAPPSEDPQ